MSNLGPPRELSTRELIYVMKGVSPDDYREACATELAERIVAAERARNRPRFEVGPTFSPARAA